MANEMLEEGDATVEGDRVQCCRPHESDEAIDDALAWLARHFSVRVNPGDDPHHFLLYYLYGLERVGRLTNSRFIGRHDWYREGAEWLTSEQEDLSGFWRGTGLWEDYPQVGTSLALLFLAKGRRPVVAAKLKHGPEDYWNHHRKDVANLVSYTEKRWGRDLTWQVIDLAAAAASDLMEAPVLYLGGEQSPELSDDDVTKLREYVNRGGFILADAVCQGEDFDRGFRTLAARMFPEPERKLHLLPPEHAVWTAEETIDPKFVCALWGIEVGCRTSVVYCPENLSCYWELARPGREWHREKKYPAEIEGRIAAARNRRERVGLRHESRAEIQARSAATGRSRTAGLDRAGQAVRGHGQALGRLECGADGAAESAPLPVRRNGTAREHGFQRREPR